jgi:hypothetical protein
MVWMSSRHCSRRQKRRGNRLVAPNRMTGGKPPIDKLGDGDVSLVKSAAEGR